MSEETQHLNIKIPYTLNNLKLLFHGKYVKIENIINLLSIELKLMIIQKLLKRFKLNNDNFHILMDKYEQNKIINIFNAPKYYSQSLFKDEVFENIFKHEFISEFTKEIDNVYTDNKKLIDNTIKDIYGNYIYNQKTYKKNNYKNNLIYLVTLNNKIFKNYLNRIRKEAYKYNRFRHYKNYVEYHLDKHVIKIKASIQKIKNQTIYIVNKINRDSKLLLDKLEELKKMNIKHKISKIYVNMDYEIEKYDINIEQINAIYNTISVFPNNYLNKILINLLDDNNQELTYPIQIVFPKFEKSEIISTIYFKLDKIDCLNYLYNFCNNKKIKNSYRTDVWKYYVISLPEKYFIYEKELLCFTYVICKVAYGYLDYEENQKGSKIELPPNLNILFNVNSNIKLENQLGLNYYVKN